MQKKGWIFLCVLFLCHCQSPTNNVKESSGDGGATVVKDGKTTTIKDGKVSSQKANITAVKATGNPGSYNFAVTIASPDKGCKQYANWWEVLSEDGKLLYRRILGHSHVSEQPFERSGGPANITATQVVWIRVHMNPGGYGGKMFTGSVQSGFKVATEMKEFSAGIETEKPLPSGCAF